MKTTNLRHISQLFNSRVLCVFFLGFSSGLPLLLTSSTLQAWYTVAGVNIVAIGFLSLVGQPYLFKFLWAPFVDRFIPPLLGRRRGWILLMQALLLSAIITMAFINPSFNPLLLACIALMVAFLSATQDIAIDAYRTDVLRPPERGIGAALGVGGYRIAMIVSGGVALIAAAQYGWMMTYVMMGLLMLIGMVTTLLAPEPEKIAKAPVSLRAAFVDPWREFISRRFGITVLIFIFLYKLNYEFSFVLTPTFLLSYMGFSLETVGSITKGFGMIALISGSLVGGLVLARIGLYRSLLLFGFLQACCSLNYVWLASIGKSYTVLIIAIGCENFCAGMEATALVAFLMSQCNPRYTATQFALLSALAVGSRVVAGPFAGLMVQSLGWTNFYLWAFIIGFPGLILLWLFREAIAARSCAPLEEVQA